MSRDVEAAAVAVADRLRAQAVAEVRFLRRLLARLPWPAPLCALWLVLGPLDVATTSYAVETSPWYVGESNPVSAALLAESVTLWAVVKMTVVTGATEAAYRRWDHVRAVPGWWLWVAALLAVGLWVAQGNLGVADLPAKHYAPGVDPSG